MTIPWLACAWGNSRQNEDHMPRSDTSNTALKASAREYAKANGVPYTEALAAVSAPDPDDGYCDCSSCTGEYTDDLDDLDPEYFIVDCEECGGSYNTQTGYGCACNPN